MNIFNWWRAKAQNHRTPVAMPPRIKKPTACPGESRKLIWKGCEYWIRDIYYNANEGTVAPEYLHYAGYCEYAIQDNKGKVTWHFCSEGAELDKIEPFRVLPQTTEGTDS